MLPTDVAGLLRAPEAPADEDVEAGTAGDPALRVIGSFLQAYLNNQLAPLWAAVAPPPAAGDGVPANAGDAVRNVWYHDAAERSFNESHLPALYLRRTRGAPADLAADWRVSTDTLSAVWIMPPMPQERQRRRDRLANALAKAVDAGIERMRWPFWVHERDLADVDAVALSRATVAAPLSLDDEALDGVVVARAFPTPRRVTVSATASAGAYSLSPITIDGFDEAGDVLTEQVTPPHVNGGWLLTTDAAFARVSRVALPAQATTAGALSVGHTADDEVLAHGSLLLLHAGLMSLKVTGWAETTVTITVTGRDGAKAQRYEAVEVTMQAEERLTTEFDDDIHDLEGVDVDFTDGDGVLIEQAQY